MCIDLDSPAVAVPPEWEIPASYEVATRKGRHILLENRGDPVRSIIGIAPQIDLLSSNRFFVGPGSRRKDGGTYEPLNDRPLAPLPDALRHLLETRATGQGEHSPFATHEILTDTPERLRLYVENRLAELYETPAGGRNASLF